ncbi:MAG: DUF2256 domain-containing protein [Saprospiraceae bacterium]|nr:DUF2256 domain-containing protein [Saprospiraceae bacterium]MCF8249996.1 DUF2256 domain-containing protein [Saprospiraceae bacterium]MCF8278964.1 DUF2256 domain-containing protein [Bacteroidales bacterium]MCF8311009.1 DUF2256 domain-containing protein [Saprospiraceae bacterium]MCF8439655.1 DUF2256 domain-containing protein [Saprospiraceae bacterium]
MKKSDLPMKICPICQRPFSWRKKWEQCWEEVKFCSEGCRKNKATPVADAGAKPLSLHDTATKKRQ